MKLTIDSAEALEDTLRVVGALYNVALEVSPTGADSNRSAQNTGTTTSSRPSRAAGASGRRGPGNRARSKQTRTGSRVNRSVSPAAVRSWARENGYTVADRGRVPADVLTAYQNA